MGFIDSFKSRLKNDDEAEFARAFREGSWPEGVDDFEPMTNTGSFLPAEPDVDPLADETLPGNRLRREEQARKAQATDVYARPEAPSPFGVIGADAKPLPYSAFAGDEGAAVVDEAAEGSVRVVERSGRRPAAPAASSSKPFAERLRERVEAANVNAPEAPAAPAAARRAAATAGTGARTTEARGDGDPARSGMWNARRVRPGEARDADAEKPSARVPRGGRSERPSVPARPDDRAEGIDADEPDGGRRPAPRRDRSVPPAPARGHDDPVPVQCEVVRPRLYDEVATIANVVVGQHRPVVIILSGSPADTSRRVLDFAFGLCCGSGAELNEIGHRVYALLPRGTALTDYDIAQLKRSGVMIRG